MSVLLRPFVLAMFCLFAAQLATAAPANGPGADGAFKQGVPRLTAIAPKASGDIVKYGAKATCFPQQAACLDDNVLVMVLVDEAGNEIARNEAPASASGEPVPSAKIISSTGDAGSGTFCTYAELYSVSLGQGETLIAADTSSCVTIE